VAEALGRAGAVYKYDLSMPVPLMYKLVEEMRTRLDGRANVLGFGHLGDGNLHLNVSTPGAPYSKAILEEIEPYVYEWVSERRGSVSAEHGIGSMKTEALSYSKSPVAIQIMSQLKTSFDPNGILNPYKVLPERAE